MERIKYGPGEFTGEFAEDRFGKAPVFHPPISVRENFEAMFKGKNPLWMPMTSDSKSFDPRIDPDNIARAFVFDGEGPYDVTKYGGPDMFGIEWVFVPVAGGSMENPEIPHLLEDVNDWEEKIQWPDIESWDWEASGELNKPLKENGKATVMMWLNGMGFERLVSFMGFENAALALVDEDQEDALKALLHKLTDLYIALVDKSVQYYDVDGFSLHDDWGSQKAPFFSEEAGRKFFLPEMKRYNDHIHSLGKFTDLHSCGHIEDRCGIFADAGFDSWTPMPMNDTIALYEKYGDRIAIGVVNDEPFDPAVATEDEQRAAARKYAQRFTKPGKLGFWSGFYNAPGQMTPAFREELYKTTRELYAE